MDDSRKTPARRPLKDDDGVAQRQLRSRKKDDSDSDGEDVLTRSANGTNTSTIGHQTASTNVSRQPPERRL